MELELCDRVFEVMDGDDDNDDVDDDDVPPEDRWETLLDEKAEKSAISDSRGRKTRKNEPSGRGATKSSKPHKSSSRQLGGRNFSNSPPQIYSPNYHSYKWPNTNRLRFRP